MRRFFLCVLVLLAADQPLWAQQPAGIISAGHRLRSVPGSRQRVQELDSLSYALHDSMPDTARRYGQQAVTLARQLQDQRGLMHSLATLGSCYAVLSDGAQALQLYAESQALARRLNDADGLVRSYTTMAAVHHERSDTASAWQHYRHALRLTGRNVLLTVTDSGRGMPANLVAELLSTGPVLASTTLLGSRTGTGLGLLLCKAFVQRHGGTLDIRSTPNGGTSVLVELPLALT